MSSGSQIFSLLPAEASDFLDVGGGRPWGAALAGVLTFCCRWRAFGWRFFHRSRGLVDGAAERPLVVDDGEGKSSGGKLRQLD